MSKISPVGSPVESLLPPLLAKIAAVVDLEQTARDDKALVRKRKVTSAVDLLKVIFLYTLGGLSLRTTAAVAAGLGIVNLENTAVLDRVRKAALWLEHPLAALLNQRCPPPVLSALGRALTIIDGTSLSLPGSLGTDWRLHLRYDPLAGRFTDLQVSDVHGAERTSNFVIRAFDLLIGDRAYAKAKDLARVLAHGGDFIVRIGWKAVVLRHADGRSFDLIALLKTIDHDRPVERAVHVAHSPTSAQTFPARLIIARKPEAASVPAATKVRHKARNQKRQIRPETLLAAQFVMVLTSLTQPLYRAELILFLYRLRWQIELAVKRLKSLLGVTEITACDPGVVRTWILAHLIAALVVDELTSPALAFSPSASARRTPATIALAPPPDRLSTALDRSVSRHHP